MTADEHDSEPSGQALPSGTRIEEFVIERVLGSGGFGITYLARDTALGRKVVIKENLPVQFAYRETTSLTIRPRHTGSDAADFAWSLENFSKEAAMLASLDHPGIVRVLRSFQALGTAYFVMPFVEGITLDELIEALRTKGQPFSEAELRGVLEHILAALDHLHDRGIYHRDIKPANILITNEGVPVLIDFGSARQRLSERSMTVVESAGYTPFEQLQSRGNVGPWSDLYALGGTIEKALTGEAPPKAMDRAFDDPWVPLARRADLCAIYSTRFLADIDRTLACRIEKRWKNAGEWLVSLQAKTVAVRRVSLAPFTQPAPVPNIVVEEVPPPPPVSQQLISKTQMRSIAWILGVLGVCGVFWLLARGIHAAKHDDDERALQQRALKANQEQQRLADLAAAEAAKVNKATKDQPFVNSLGMKFVPVKIAGGTSAGQQVLFSIWETRVQDFEAFVEATGYDAIKDSPNGAPACTVEKEGTGVDWKQAGGTWKDPRFPPDHGQNGEHPVVCVSFPDAEAFCVWLTKRDAAKLPSGWRYRLPTDEEWSAACGVGEFPWGDNYPPGSKDGNYSGTETMIGPLQGVSEEFSKAGRSDGWARTAQVGKFTPNRYGLFDMGGNAWEWCGTWYKASMNDTKTLKAVPALKEDGGGQAARVVRGGSWYNSVRVLLRSGCRFSDYPRRRKDNYGFRVVLVGGGG
jgi:serine/threonine protein kinase/formylglycine-generating enzyme required for sulfatase activity